MVAHAPPTSTPTFHPGPSPLCSQDEALGFSPEWITALAGIGTVATLWLILMVIGWLMGLCRVQAPAQPPINRRPNLPNVPAVIAQANRRAIRRPSPPANPSVNPVVNIAVAFPAHGAHGPTTLKFIFNRPLVQYENIPPNAPPAHGPALSSNFNGPLVQYRYAPLALTTGNEVTLTSATATMTYCYQGWGPILYLGEMSDFILQKK